MRKTISRGLVGLALGAPLLAQAAAVSIHYSANFNGVSITTSGVMQIADLANANGSFEVLGMSGTRTVNGDVQSIVDVATSGGGYLLDNDLFLDPTLNDGRYFSIYGLLFSTLGASGAHLVNIFDNFNGAYGLPAGYGESSFPDNPAYNPVASITSLQVSVVPEPATLALVAIAGASALIRRRKREAATPQ